LIEKAQKAWQKASKIAKKAKKSSTIGKTLQLIEKDLNKSVKKRKLSK
jgi:hypothetical protein